MFLANLIFDCDTFGFQILIEGIFSEVLAETTLFEASEWSSHVGFVVSVDENSSSFQPVGYLQSLVNVLCEYSTGQTEFGVVGPLDDFFNVTGKQKKSKP